MQSMFAPSTPKPDPRFMQPGGLAMPGAMPQMPGGMPGPGHAGPMQPGGQGGVCPLCQGSGQSQMGGRF